ncbi:hypothetical protein A11A3_06176 [Alcanivorax hongdengensis A-11-3]|uniref:Lipoprotein n=1 Tax=Alcanivorax hongdengensis A-11-3 TaxID=1177179 RepID=L0WDW3_9GAMM|nr:hypothetical protein [Alcanivorax hongdengensis]EKF75018.1 hypothetical protein A11A3_06176 [Alcanivorax hongdengensis A-11-3]
MPYRSAPLFRYLVRCLLAAAPVLLAGCATSSFLPSFLQARQSVPDSVSGLSYPAIDRLGAMTGPCLALAEAHQNGRRITVTLLQQQWLPDCRRRIEQARARQEALQLTRAVEQAWRQVQAHGRAQQAERARLQARRQTLRQPAVKSGKNERAEASDTVSEQARRHHRERLRAATINELLRGVPDLPMAYTLGQPSSLSLTGFLSCLEVAYPNQGYEIEQRRDSLVVKALQADMLRGDVTIESHFSRAWGTWVLQQLSVAQVSASRARDRYRLARNLLADECPEALISG